MQNQEINQEIIVLLIFHVVYNCLLPHFASMSDEYRAMTVYANNDCDDLSAQKKRFHRFPNGIFKSWGTEFSWLTNSGK